AVDAEVDAEECFGRHAGPRCRCAAAYRKRSEGGHQTSTNCRGEARPVICLDGVQAREVERDCLRPGWANGGRGSRADEPRGLVENRRYEGAVAAEGNGCGL